MPFFYTVSDMMMVRSLRQNPKLDKIKDKRDRLHELETVAACLVLETSGGTF
jgi:hypothetical protein